MAAMATRTRPCRPASLLMMTRGGGYLLPHRPVGAQRHGGINYDVAAAVSNPPPPFPLVVVRWGCRWRSCRRHLRQPQACPPPHI